MWKSSPRWSPDGGTGSDIPSVRELVSFRHRPPEGVKIIINTRSPRGYVGVISTVHTHRQHGRYQGKQVLLVNFHNIVQGCHFTEDRAFHQRRQFFGPCSRAAKSRKSFLFWHVLRLLSSPTTHLA